MTEFPTAYLTEWPARFRFAELVLAMAAQRPVDPGLAVDAILAGFIEDHDELEVFGDLLDGGEFDAAEWMLTQCSAFDDDRVRVLNDRLIKERADARQLLAARLAGLVEQAHDAGLRLDVNDDDLEGLCAAGRPLAEARLAQAESRLAEEIERKRSQLRDRLTGTSDLDLGYRETIEAFFDNGHLGAVERILDGTATEQERGPEGVPRLPSLEWDRPAEVILRWHLDPHIQLPPSFRPVTEQRASELLAAYDALRGGGAAAAQGFAEALDGFLLGHEGAQRRVTQRQGGFLTELFNVFLDHQTSQFSRRSRVRLFVAEPEVADIPAEISQLEGPFIAIGPSLARPSLPARRNGAVITLDDLLRLVLIRNRRPVVLLRLLGRQWPTRVFTGETPQELERLLGRDEDERWPTLSWLVDLCGLGDTTVADAIAFETGLDSELIWLFLDYLDRRRIPGPQDAAGARGIVREWRADRRMPADVERAVLGRLGTDTHAVVAFWAALAAAPPGHPAPVGELAAVAADVAAAPGVSDGVSVDWADEIHNADADLLRLWLVRAEGDGGSRTVTLSRCGVLEVLAGLARQRLRAACELRAEQVKHAESESRRELTLLAFHAYRHALSRRRAEYAALASDPGASADDVNAALKAMYDETARILEAEPQLTGTCDLGVVLNGMVENFHRTYRDIGVMVEGSREVTAAVSQELAEVVLYELLANAAQAMADLGGGEIEISVDASEPDELLIHVRDSGQGIDVPNAGRRIFRDTYSTHGDGHGLGLYNAQGLARKVKGDLALVEPTSSDPALGGAHFLLTLPRC